VFLLPPSEDRVILPSCDRRTDGHPDGQNCRSYYSAVKITARAEAKSEATVEAFQPGHLTWRAWPRAATAT